MGERVSFPQLQCRAEDLGDPMQWRHPDVGHVVDDVRGEEFVESVELSVVEQVAVYCDRLADRASVLCGQLDLFNSFPGDARRLSFQLGRSAAAVRVSDLAA